MTTTAHQDLATFLANSTISELIAAMAEAERHNTKEWRVTSAAITSEVATNHAALRDWIAARGTAIYAKYQAPLDDAAEARGESALSADEHHMLTAWMATPYSRKMRVAIRALSA